MPILLTAKAGEVIEMPDLISINSKGYGKIHKAVMRNSVFPLLAKTIYAYICAYAGCGCMAFPKWDKIVRDLQINKVPIPST